MEGEKNAHLHLEVNVVAHYCRQNTSECLSHTPLNSLTHQIICIRRVYSKLWGSLTSKECSPNSENNVKPRSYSKARKKLKGVKYSEKESKQVIQVSQRDRATPNNLRQLATTSTRLLDVRTRDVWQMNSAPFREFPEDAEAGQLPSDCGLIRWKVDSLLSCWWR